MVDHGDEVATAKRTDDETPASGNGPMLIHALDGFLGAGSAARLAADQLRSGHGEVVHEFDLDSMFDYRARRPMIAFREDHYAEYDDPTLQIVLEHDDNGGALLPDGRPRAGLPVGAVHRRGARRHRGARRAVDAGLGAVPMGVPHTRPTMITAHGTRPELVDRQNLWSAQVMVPSSAQSLLEYRLGQWGHDAAGYVVHVPHYLAQIDYPTASLALIDALVDRTGLSIDVDGRCKARQEAAHRRDRAADRGAGRPEPVGGLEEQYDAFTRGAAQSLLASDEELPSGDELADQFEQFLARSEHSEGRD